MRAEETRSAARSLDRVAALCAAGIPAEHAWRTVAEHDPVLVEIGRAPDVGAGLAAVAARTPEGPWAGVAALWSIAERTGAPSVPALTATASAIRQDAATRRAIRVALAGPVASGRVVLALPLLGVVLGALVGADTLGVLLGTPVGWGCIAVSGALVSTARAWTRRLVRAATPGQEVPGLVAEAWGIALSGGGSWIEAERAVSEAFTAFGERLGPESDGERAEVEDALDLARSAGVPAAGLLRALAGDLRNEAAADGLADAERLGVRLVLPLGVCLLPAFVVVGIVPVVVGILSSTVESIR